jgi:hypothetical protein
MEQSTNEQAPLQSTRGIEDLLYGDNKELGKGGHGVLAYRSKCTYYENTF